MSTHPVAPFPTKPLKRVVTLRRSRVAEPDDDRPYVGLECVESWTGQLTRQETIPDKQPPALTNGTSLGNLFEPGDVLFSKLRPYLAKAWVAEFPGRCTTEFLVMRPIEASPYFLRYVCLSHGFVAEVDASTFGSRMPRADWAVIGRLRVPSPDLHRQNTIVDYLDAETERLDALISEKQRVVELLAERRRAIIARAVTRGLDRGVPTRGSSIPELEQIPAHWSAVRLRHLLTDIEQGWSPRADVTAPSADAWGVLKLNAVNRGRYDDAAAKALPPDVRPRKDLEIRAGDVLVTRSNTPQRVGDACFVGATRSKLMLSDIIYRLGLRSDVIDGRFLVYFLTLPVGRVQIEHDARGTSASMVKVSQELMKDWRIPVPPVEDQRLNVATL
ncbi:MAG: hypothetical protein F4012_01445, partial [Gemmatimonadales bacterium]|nr:hypothetical protein [Gemmatimonadales bacterium]